MSLLASVISILIQSVVIFCMIFSDPIVIYEKDGERLGYDGKKREIVITEKEIKELVKKFVKNRYEWQKFDPPLIAKNLSSFTKDDLIQKIEKNLEKEKAQFESQSVNQYVGNIKVSIDEKNRIIGNFDKIIRINQIPFVSEVQILVGVVKGIISSSNKLGLYINSVVSYEPK